MTFQNKWVIYDKLKEVNQLLTDDMYKIDDEKELEEMMKLSIEIDKWTYRLME